MSSKRSHFLVYWKSSEIQRALASPGRLTRVPSNQLKHRRVGDRLWICGLDGSDRFVLIGYLDIHRLLTTKELVALLRAVGDTGTPFGRDFHALAAPGQAVPMRAIPLEPHLSLIEFEGTEVTGIEILPGGRINAQRLQTFRRLTERSASALTAIWDKEDAGPSLPTPEAEPEISGPQMTPDRGHRISKSAPLWEPEDATPPTPTDERSRPLSPPRPNPHSASLLEARRNHQEQFQKYVVRHCRSRGFATSLYFLEATGSQGHQVHVGRSVRDERREQGEASETAHVFVLFPGDPSKDKPEAVWAYPETRSDDAPPLRELALGSGVISREDLSRVSDDFAFGSLQALLTEWPWKPQVAGKVEPHRSPASTETQTYPMSQHRPPDPSRLMLREQEKRQMEQVLSGFFTGRGFSTQGLFADIDVSGSRTLRVTRDMNLGTRGSPDSSASAFIIATFDSAYTETGPRALYGYPLRRAAEVGFLDALRSGVREIPIATIDTVPPEFTFRSMKDLLARWAWLPGEDEVQNLREAQPLDDGSAPERARANTPAPPSVQATSPANVALADPVSTGGYEAPAERLSAPHKPSLFGNHSVELRESNRALEIGALLLLVALLALAFFV